MKYLMILTVGVCLLFAAVPAVAQSAADEAAVREATKQFMAAYNKHDTKAIVELIDEECRQWGDAVKGKTAYAKWYGERFERSKDLQVKLSEEISVDFITPDIAIHKFRTETTGSVDEDGNLQPPGKGLRAYLYVKKNGQWLRRTQFWRPITEE